METITGTPTSEVSADGTGREGTNDAGGWFDFAELRARIAPSEPRLASALTWIAAFLAITGVFYGVFVPMTPGRLARPTAALFSDVPLWAFVSRLSAPGVDNATVVGALLILAGMAAFSLYGLAVYLTWRRPSSRRILWLVFAASFVFVNIHVWALPNVNTDIFNYMMRGRIAAVYGEIPYYVAADEFPDDPIYPYASHRYTSWAGGKLLTWMLLNVTLASIAGDDPVRNLLVYRSALALFTFGSIALVAMILRRSSPQFLLAGTILFAWSPIVTHFGPAKTDTVMVFFLLLGIYLLSRNLRLAAIVPLALSCFVKLVSLPLVAVLFARQLLQRRWREVLIGGALFMATTLVVYAPFSNGFDLFVFHLIFVEDEAASSAPGVFRPILKYGFFAMLAWAALAGPRNLDGMLRGWALVMLYFSLFIIDTPDAWYLMIFIALAALSRDPSIVAGMVLLSMSTFVIYTWNSTSSSVFRLATVSFLPRQVIYVMPLVAAAAALTVFTLWRRAPGARARARYRAGVGARIAERRA